MKNLPLSVKIGLILVCVFAMGWAATLIRRSRPLKMSDLSRQAQSMHQTIGTRMARMTSDAVGGTGSILVLEPAEEGLVRPSHKQGMADLIDSFYAGLERGVTPP